MHMQTTDMHVFAEFGRYPLQISWHALAGKYLTRLETMGTLWLLKHAFIADRRLKPEVSWCLRLEDQLKGDLIPSPTEEQPNHRTAQPPTFLSCFSPIAACGAAQPRILLYGRDIPPDQAGLCLRAIYTASQQQPPQEDHSTVLHRVNPLAPHCDWTPQKATRAR